MFFYFFSEIAGSNPTLAFKFQRDNMLLPRSFVKIKQSEKPPWLRGSVLDLRPPGLEFRIMCLNGSVISFIVAIAAPRAWNGLSPEISDITDEHKVITSLKTGLFREADSAYLHN